MQDRVKELVSQLNSDDTQEIAYALRDIHREPTGNAELVKLIEMHLDNEAIALLGIPFRYAEIRFIAAQALSAEQKFLGTYKPFMLRNTFSPIQSEKIYELVNDGDLEVVPLSPNRNIQLLEKLARENRLPRINRAF